MPTDRPLPSGGRRRCLLCNRLFEPHPKVKERQRVCSNPTCQRLRQKLNHLDWLERNPVDYARWYQDYGKAWRQSHPDYQQQYRRRNKAASPQGQRLRARLRLEAVRLLYQTKKKEELTNEKTKGSVQTDTEKKEELTPYFYLLKAKELVLVPLDVEKKEQLTCRFA